jgi:folate-binding protein YgfZ
MTAYQAIHEDAAWLDLSNRGRLQITGEDAGRLLHALSTNDIKNLPPGEGLHAFFLNAQGRILGDAYIFHREHSFFLDTEPEVKDKLRDHIDKYIIADDAIIEPVEGWDELSLEGPNASGHAASLELPVPGTLHAIEDWQGGFIARLAVCTTEGLRVFGPQSAIANLRNRLHKAGIPQLNPDDARVVRLENGIPRYSEDISERYLVQETGQLQAVHFTKGCYLGQEIVERVRSRAQVHRHLHSVRIKSSEAPAPGTKLTRDGADLGEITSAAYSPLLHEVAALAYLRTQAIEDRRELTLAGSDIVAYLPEAHLTPPTA